MTVDPLWKDGVQVYPYVIEQQARGVTGFDFAALNRKYLATPANDATAYGVSIQAATQKSVWRCIGAYHLTPDQNRGRHNVFVEVLDESGKRTRNATIKWRWYMDAPIQTRLLDKPDDEPAADIPLEAPMTVSIYLDGEGLPSDNVGNLHSRHGDEKGSGGETFNSYGHHSVYLVFQRQKGGVVIIIDPPDETDLAAEVAALKKRLNGYDSIIKEWAALVVSLQGDGK